MQRFNFVKLSLRARRRVYVIIILFKRFFVPYFFTKSLISSGCKIERFVVSAKCLKGVETLLRRDVYEEEKQARAYC